MFNRYIVETKHEGENGFYNTVNHVFLTYETPKEEFRKHLFLKEQEEECVKTTLRNRKEKHFNATIILGWECNLRCKHCVVLKQLKRPGDDPANDNFTQLINFVRSYQKFGEYEGISLSFVGGEPLLYLDQIYNLRQQLCDEDIKFYMTTNLTVPLDEDKLEKIKCIESITVSIDGGPESHNAQRIPLYKTESVFNDVIQNIKKLIINGMIKKIRVQAALTEDRNTKENAFALYEILMPLGITAKMIKIGCVHPTNHKPEASNDYLNLLKKGLMSPKPCCKYRTESLMIDKNDVYSDFYEQKKIGTIYDPPEVIEERRYQECILKMPVLHDEKCKTCPVIGYCWGGCTNGGTAIHDYPSRFCNQNKLIENVTIKANNGTLTKYLRS
jgi:radical SAM protein with 4Fe4S-binding SPASM domain